ncbi:hypothetical protein SH1V18_42180 [Vallitalea longa]|uniref:Uncharacterized protein n=1 Tax=Vallitalea longa TaxID=2936439 RepID=A0A9W5YI76_9FIRM|nr:hypothetical protein [Vallitalea longa]GKX31738.1 hypothetical protein SH1V18_42180 [Vallitalea longa]
MKTPKLKVSITYYFGICKLITSIFLQNEALGVIIVSDIIMSTRKSGRKSTLVMYISQ